MRPYGRFDEAADGAERRHFEKCFSPNGPIAIDWVADRRSYRLVFAGVRRHGRRTVGTGRGTSEKVAPNLRERKLCRLGSILHCTGCWSGDRPVEVVKVGDTRGRVRTGLTWTRK